MAGTGWEVLVVGSRTVHRKSRRMGDQCRKGRLWKLHWLWASNLDLVKFLSLVAVTYDFAARMIVCKIVRLRAFRLSNWPAELGERTQPASSVWLQRYLGQITGATPKLGKGSESFALRFASSSAHAVAVAAALFGRQFPLLGGALSRSLLSRGRSSLSCADWFGHRCEPCGCACAWSLNGEDCEGDTCVCDADRCKWNWFPAPAEAKIRVWTYVTP